MGLKAAWVPRRSPHVFANVVLGAEVPMLLDPGRCTDVVRNALRILRAAITRGDKQNINTGSLEPKTQRFCEYEFRSSGAVLISLPSKPLRGNSPAAGSPGAVSYTHLRAHET